MTDSLEKQGGCLCGAVTYQVTNLNPEVGVCHCGMCMKWTGGPAMAVNVGSEISFQGEEHIGRYRSSDWGERGFCKNCGSHLFFQLVGQDQYFIQAGSLYNLDGLKLYSQIFIDRKPPFYSFAEQTQVLTEAEFLALFN